MNFRDMTPEDYEELVEAIRSARHPIPLGEEQIKALAQRARILEVMRGEIVIQQGGQPDAFYFIISGQLRAADTSGPEPRLLNYHAARTFVGEHAMLTGEPRAATVDVVSDAKLAWWDQTTFQWLLRLDHRVQTYFEELYRHREKRTRQPFIGKHWDEVTVIHNRKHPLVLFNALTFPLLLLLFSVGMLILLLETEVIPTALAGVMAGMPAIISALWGLYNFVDWADDEYIVTSKRVIHIERYVFYGEERDEAPLIRIQDVTVQATNLWERLLNYYDVIIKTAGAGQITFAGIQNAEQVKEAIFEERAKAMERREAADRASIRRALAQRMHVSIPPDVALPVDILQPTSGYFAQAGKRRLPRFLDYLWPRMSVVEGDAIIWRKHWFIWLAKTWPALMLLVILLALMIPALLGLSPFAALERNVWAPALVLGVGMLATFVWYVYLYDDWHRDVYIVTSDRIADIESSSFRLRGEQRREGTFDVIQDITYVIPTFLHRLLNMGNVIIQTAGTAATFTFINVFDPSAIQQEIFNRMVAFQEKQRQQQRVREDTRTAEWFDVYHQLREPGGERQ